VIDIGEANAFDLSQFKVMEDLSLSTPDQHHRVTGSQYIASHP